MTAPPAESRKEFFLGFGGIPIDRIDEGIRRLSEVWLEGGADRERLQAELVTTWLSGSGAAGLPAGAGAS